MLNNVMMVVLFVLGMYLLITSVQTFMAGNTEVMTIVYISLGAILVAYNARVVSKLFGGA
jgi:hypothetical protein